ncbi:uncharacterized protein BBA_01451 [Beauveria bassiana ARSEF 2860]|uniref:Uncharacterized protein n=1 Tax=Beauveria bassiana (strain ARSEF 2860) TaxID=655819 RepID=J5K5X8_BEAB2|nr:uncharacterized protein BBA_01451 [Beauveria bassiana ARSEF 2860]EJP69486.1 hypothetical protein BBA_01451 [Beauveria bassiana ARSEF 2860]
MEEGFGCSATISFQSAARIAQNRDAYKKNSGDPEQYDGGVATSFACPRRIKLFCPSTSPPPEPPQERYMVPGDDQYRIVEDELLETAQRFTTHLHRAEYTRLKLIARSKNDAAIREIKRPVIGPLTSDAKRRRDRAQRLSKQRSVLSAQDGSTTQDESANGSSPWVGTNLRGLLNAPRAESRTLAAPPMPSAVPSSRTKAAAGHHPPRPPSSPRQRPADGGSFATPVATGRARHPATPATLSGMASSSSAPSRPAKNEAETRPPEDDDLDFDDPFGINKRRLDRQKSRDQLKKSIRSTPTKVSSSDSMPSFV